MTMSAMKREAVHAAIRNQLMNDPKNGTLLLLNIMKLFADKKDDAEFIKELADIASDLEIASMTTDATPVAMESPRQQVYPQPALFHQPVMQNPVVTGHSGMPANQNFQENLPTPPQTVAGDVLSALNGLGQDTTSYQTPKNEPVIQGYREWSPRTKKK